MYRDDRHEYSANARKKIKQGIRQILSNQITTEQTHRSSLETYHGLLKDTLQAPTDWGETCKTQDVQIWIKRDTKLYQLKDDSGNAVTVTVTNHDPSLILQKGANVIVARIEGDWEIIWAGCSTYASKVT